ncbi:MAG TPA: hypothetical protein VN726_20170 [Hanamia sp.]|nr:hypothetical protein [Hanamia sp.]
MDKTQPVRQYWIMFFISSIIIILFLIFIREYFWLILPWVLTSFCKAMRII